MISLHDDFLLMPMTTEYKTDNMVQLAFAVLLQAVRDYVRLRELGIVSGAEVREYRFYRKYSGGAAGNKPLGFESSEKVKELIYFLSGRDLDNYCNLLRIPACRIRSAIGLTKVDMKRPLITMEDINRVEQSQGGSMYYELLISGGVK